jgi:hypothetical protein
VEEVTYRMNERRACSNGMSANIELGTGMVSSGAPEKETAKICNEGMK